MPSLLLAWALIARSKCAQLFTWLSHLKGRVLRKAPVQISLDLIVGQAFGRHRLASQLPIIIWLKWEENGFCFLFCLIPNYLRREVKHCPWKSHPYISPPPALICLKDVVGYFSPVWNSLCDKFSCFQGSVHGYPYENQKSIFFDRDKQTIL